MKWPVLKYEAFRPTRETLHRCMQIVGKVRLALTPRENHFWNVAFHLTPRGLTSRPMPYRDRTFAIDFDFVDHQVVVATSEGTVRCLRLGPRPVADFFTELTALLADLGIRVDINDRPVEILTDPIPLHRDTMHRSYEAAEVERWFGAVRRAATVLEQFRARFAGKSSPVHFWWGSFDLSVSRYSLRRAPPRPGADTITREAYSHETTSCGFWPGDERLREAAFFAYAAPVPDDFSDSDVAPEDAEWNQSLGEFILPYEAVRAARDPEAALLEFAESTYRAASDLLGWDNRELLRETATTTTTAPAESPPPLNSPPPA